MAHSRIYDYYTASSCNWLPAGAVVVLHVDGRREIITPGRREIITPALVGFNEHGERFITAEAFALMLHTLRALGRQITPADIDLGKP